MFRDSKSENQNTEVMDEKLSVSDWKVKFVSLGCDPNTFDVLIKTETVSNYKNLYFSLSKTERPDLSLWALLCLSGESHVKFASENNSDIKQKLKMIIPDYSSCRLGCLVM